MRGGECNIGLAGDFYYVRSFLVAGDRIRLGAFFGTPCGDYNSTLGYLNVSN